METKGDVPKQATTAVERMEMAAGVARLICLMQIIEPVPFSAAMSKAKQIMAILMLALAASGCAMPGAKGPGHGRVSGQRVYDAPAPLVSSTFASALRAQGWTVQTENPRQIGYKNPFSFFWLQTVMWADLREVEGKTTVSVDARNTMGASADLLGRDDRVVEESLGFLDAAMKRWTPEDIATARDQRWRPPVR